MATIPSVFNRLHFVCVFFLIYILSLYLLSYICIYVSYIYTFSVCYICTVYYILCHMYISSEFRSADLVRQICPEGAGDDDSLGK